MKRRKWRDAVHALHFDDCVVDREELVHPAHVAIEVHGGSARRANVGDLRHDGVLGLAACFVHAGYLEAHATAVGTAGGSGQQGRVGAQGDGVPVGPRCFGQETIPAGTFLDTIRWLIGFHAIVCASICLGRWVTIRGSPIGRSVIDTPPLRRHRTPFRKCVCRTVSLA